MKSLAFSNGYLKMGIAASAFFLMTVFSTPHAEALVQKKMALNARLDSLEMEKQQKKRKGQSLASQDSIIALLKDSITQIKQDISLTSDSVAPVVTPDTAAAVVTPPQRSFFAPVFKALAAMRVLPNTALDWIIAALAIVALLSGIVLLIGLLRTFVFRPKKSKRPFVPVQRAPTPYTASGTRGDVPLQKRTTSLPTVPPGNGFDVEALRRTIRRSELEEPVAEAPVFPAEPSAAENAPDGETLKQQIIAAGGEGLSVSEISRKFHVSVDQVALILKIAGKKP
ncbi:MAG: hypothetical protein PHC61_07090 [Chitinivibrionales bacterium]|nr:hypothetical protein [Chitinivibrionales bacterium]